MPERGFTLLEIMLVIFLIGLASAGVVQTFATASEPPAKKAAQEMKEGGILTVYVDNEIAVQNLQKFAGQKGYEASGKKIEEKVYEVTIHVTAAEGQMVSSGQEEEIACTPDIRKKGITVVVSSDQMGNGEEKLGRTLMKAFLFALTRQDELPETIMFYNSGAFLSCEGSQSLEDLKNL